MERGLESDVEEHVRHLSPAGHKRWQRAIARVYARMRFKAERGQYCVRCNDIEVIVFPEVYAPRFFTDSLWFAEQLPAIVRSKSLLEVGTGTGLIAIACAINGARVVGTDINPAAVKNARVNARRKRVQMSVRQGDLFEALGPTERFDFIFWAHPFNNWRRPVSDTLLRSGRDYLYESLRGYIEGARKHLTPRGRLLLGTGDSADLRTMSKMAKENGYQLKLLSAANMPLAEGGRLQAKYLLYELKGASASRR